MAGNLTGSAGASAAARPPGRVVLVVGGGGREHALAKRLARSASVARVLITPGNAGTELVGRNVPLGPTGLSSEHVLGVCERESVDLVVIGPEGPLCAGVADELRKKGVA